MSQIQSRLAIFALGWGIGLAILSAKPAWSSEANNPMFYYTHLQPSPFTVRAGRLLIGTDLIYGVTDFLQVGTSILRDVYKVYNANAKISLIDYEEFALALTGEWESYNLRDIDSANEDIKVTSWGPGMVTAFGILPKTALIVGGKLHMTEIDVNTDRNKTSGYVQGAQVGSDISFAYNPPAKRGIGNVMSAGMTYDVTYKYFGFGLSHHWPGFHFGFHYYPNADKYRVQPIIQGGMAVDI